MKKLIVCMLAVLLAFGAVFAVAEEEDRLTFRTTELNGTPVDESLLAGYDIVLFNFWEPWCGFCVEEMPALEKLYQAYKEKGILVVGVVNRDPYPGLDPESVIRETGVTYPILNYCDAFESVCPGYAFPASFFTDGQGHVIDVKGLLCRVMLSVAREEAEDYRAGEYDVYLNDPAYAEYSEWFGLMRLAAEGGEAELEALAAYEVEDRCYGTDVLYGSLTEEEWTELFLGLRAAY